MPRRKRAQYTAAQLLGALPRDVYFLIFQWLSYDTIRDQCRVLNSALRSIALHTLEYIRTHDSMARRVLFRGEPRDLATRPYGGGPMTHCALPLGGYLLLVREQAPMLQVYDSRGLVCSLPLPHAQRHVGALKYVFAMHVLRAEPRTLLLLAHGDHYMNLFVYRLGGTVLHHAKIYAADCSALEPLTSRIDADTLLVLCESAEMYKRMYMMHVPLRDVVERVARNASRRHAVVGRVRARCVELRFPLGQRMSAPSMVTYCGMQMMDSFALDGDGNLLLCARYYDAHDQTHACLLTVDRGCGNVLQCTRLDGLSKPDALLCIIGADEQHARDTVSLTYYSKKVSVMRVDLRRAQPRPASPREPHCALYRCVAVDALATVDTCHHARDLRLPCQHTLLDDGRLLML